MPAQKTSPAPVMTSTLVAGSSRSCSSAAVMSRCSCGFMALRLAGRFSVMTATSSCLSISKVSNCTGVSPTATLAAEKTGAQDICQIARMDANYPAYEYQAHRSQPADCLRSADAGTQCDARRRTARPVAAGGELGFRTAAPRAGRRASGAQRPWDAADAPGRAAGWLDLAGAGFDRERARHWGNVRAGACEPLLHADAVRYW